MEKFVFVTLPFSKFDMRNIFSVKPSYANGARKNQKCIILGIKVFWSFFFWRNTYFYQLSIMQRAKIVLIGLSIKPGLEIIYSRKM